MDTVLIFFSQVYGSLFNKDKWCIIENDDQSNSFLWNDITRAYSMAHVSMDENQWEVMADFWTEANSSNFKWNVTYTANNLSFIRLFDESEYVLAVTDHGELYLSEYNSTDINQQWIIKD